MPHSDVPAVRSALRVLDHLAARAGPAPAAAVAQHLGLPRSSVYRLLTVLREEGYVTHLREERRYTLGPAAHSLATAYTRQAPLTRLARPVLARLVDATGLSAHLAVLDGRDVLYLVDERAPGGPPLVTDVEVRLPSHLTAIGRAILARLPAAHVRALYPNRAVFADRTGVGPRSLGELREVLRLTRRRGYAVEDGEVMEGVASVGRAIVAHTGFPLGGVALSFPSAVADDARRGELAVALGRAAAEIGRRLGGGA
ncbi:IclR family transcriptional regulator [Xylanimonas allomyrinae]|nr:IclR family transcriptional regulator [Xylanimonas allomyrinae]